MYKNLTAGLLFLAMGLNTATQAHAENRCEQLLGIKKNAKLSNSKDFISEILKTKDPVQVIKLVVARYPEMTWLTGSVNATPEGKGTAIESKSISEQLFGQKHIEFDRTATGILLLKWIIEDN